MWLLSHASTFAERSPQDNPDSAISGSADFG
jgi:hypothetical protein